jgi:tetratricopeptide (TPR) repeat protein
MSDSLLAPLDTMIAANPREPLFRTMQLRTLQILRRDAALRDAFERWARAMPRDPTPYREYARVLIQLGRPAAADTIVMRGRAALGSLRDLQYENAQLRAAMGDWVASATSWRLALNDAPHLSSAAAYALARAPAASRDEIRAALAPVGTEQGPRRALSELELAWGRPREAWDALRTLRPDTTSASVWEDFGERAYADERWSIARDAFVNALGARRSPHVAARAAAAALKAGAPNDVFTMLPLAGLGGDSVQALREAVPLHVSALVALGRGAEAEAMVSRYERVLTPAQHMRLAQSVATAWVRAGDLQKARAALRAAGPDADSSDAAGWLALYEGRLDAARTLLRTQVTATPDLTLALGIIARTKGDYTPTLGAAFLALARNDSIAAAGKFVEAAQQHPEVAPALLLISSRMWGARVETSIPMWKRIVTEFPGTPEAVESELEWARALRKRGDSAGATNHLEHLIISAPQSALLPQARRELEQLRGSVPPG